jgi:hypothetical protein
MILKNKQVNGEWSVDNGQWAMDNGLEKGNNQLKAKNYRLWTIVNAFKIMLFLFTCNCLFSCAGCKYSFKDVSIPVEVKTFRVNFFENKARYINPNLSPQLTEKLKDKIRGNTRLTQTNNDDAHYDIL